MKRYLLLAAALHILVAEAAAAVKTYPAPDGARLNNTFAVEVRQAGDNEWCRVDVYNVMVDEVIGTKHTVKDSSMAAFDFDGVAEVRVHYNAGTVGEVRIRPESCGIDAKTDGNTFTFAVDRPRNLSVEVNGDIFNNLHLFANPMDASEPSPKELKKLLKDKNFIYFGPGYHRLDDVLRIGSNQWLYVAGGAVVDGEVVVENAENVRVTGRGMIYPERKMGIMVSRSHNVEIEGIFTTQCAVGGSNGVKISNVKVMSYYGWGDGFNVFASSNVHYDGVFARTSDDCTTIYATRKGFKGGCRNITTENSVLWADVAHPFMIGLHGNPEEPDTIEDVVYRNVDILDMKEKQIDYQGVFAVVAGDDNLVRNVLFEDIRVENFRQGKLFDIRICFNKKYCTAPGRGIENVTFRNISYNGDRSELSMIIGYDETRKVRNITFENLVINGLKISDDMEGKPAWYKTGDMARIFIGEHTENIIFR